MRVEKIRSTLEFEKDQKYTKFPHPELNHFSGIYSLGKGNSEKQMNIPNHMVVAKKEWHGKLFNILGLIMFISLFH